jgi:hypothetical protein
MAMSTVATALALTACGDAQPQQATPSSSASSVSPTPGPDTAPDPTQPTIFGKLSVLFALTTRDSVVPQPPLTYTLIVRTPGATRGTPHEVNADGTFALVLPPGTYELWYLQIEAADLDPFTLPLKSNATDPAKNESVALHARATGCVYGGEVNVVYGRLPAVSETKQDALVAQASKNNNERYAYVYHPKGGFVIAGASVSMPANDKRPLRAQNCVAEKFGWVTA